MQTKKIIFILVVLVGILVVGSGFVRNVAPVAAAQPGEANQTNEEQTEIAHTLLDVIQNNSQLNDFETLIKAAGMADNLEKDGPFTVFALTDAAMASFDELVTNGQASATDILLYHILNGRFDSPNLANQNTMTTLLGEQVAIIVRDGQIVLNDADNPVTIATTVEAENGVIHIIDTVLMPPNNSLITTPKGSPELTIDEVLAADGRFTTFLSLIETTGLQNALANPASNYTVFAPTDDAIAKLSEEQLDHLLADPKKLETILSYHLVGDMLGINQIATDDYIPTLNGRPLIVDTDEDQQVFLNGHPLTEFNIIAANGVIHVVDTVLLP